MELGLLAPRTVADLLAALVQEYQLQGRKSTPETVYRIRVILRHLGDKAVSAITPSLLRQYAKARIAEGRSGATVNREFAALRRAMNLAYQDGTLERVPKFPVMRETGIRQGTYTREEFERIVGKLAPHLKAVAWFGYLTGRRRGELLQIRWEDVNLEEGFITIRANTTKTGQPDRLPVTEELMAVIQAMPRSGEWLFMYRGQRLKHFQKGWRRATRQAGLPGKLFHDLRRTVATDLINAGVSQKTAMAITGHKTTAVFLRYQIVRQDEVKSALDKLNDYRKGNN